MFILTVNCFIFIYLLVYFIKPHKSKAFLTHVLIPVHSCIKCTEPLTGLTNKLNLQILINN